MIHRICYRPSPFEKLSSGKPLFMESHVITAARLVIVGQQRLPVCGLGTYWSGTHDQFGTVYRRDLTYQVDNLLCTDPIVWSQRSSGCNAGIHELGESELRRLSFHMICEHVRVRHQCDVRLLVP